MDRGGAVVSVRNPWYGNWVYSSENPRGISRRCGSTVLKLPPEVVAAASHAAPMARRPCMSPGFVVVAPKHTAVSVVAVPSPPVAVLIPKRPVVVLSPPVVVVAL